jgi:hypothetical protein
VTTFAEIALVLGAVWTAATVASTKHRRRAITFVVPAGKHRGSRA